MQVTFYLKLNFKSKSKPFGNNVLTLFTINLDSSCRYGTSQTRQNRSEFRTSQICGNVYVELDLWPYKKG